MSVRLRNGLEVELRPIRAEDRVGLAESHARLSPATQRARFLTAKPRLTGAELRYLTEIDGWNHVALVAVIASGGPPGEIVAVGRFVRLAGTPGSAEFAIVVGDSLQGQGLGTALAIALAEAARARGIRRFTATALSENVAVHRLLRTIAHHLEPTVTSGGVDELVAELAA
ncbi:MAG: GNAT family N-acetyltransferase [Solirubrobacteraceae bacterium]